MFSSVMFDFLGGYQRLPKILFSLNWADFQRFDSVPFAELVRGRPKLQLLDNGSLFSEVTEDVRSFPKVTKHRTNKHIMDDSESEFLSSCSVLRYV